LADPTVRGRPPLNSGVRPHSKNSMNPPTRVAIAAVLLILAAIYTGYVFAVGLDSGVVACPGTKCGGISSAATEPYAYWLFMGVYGVSTLAMAASAVFCIYKLFRWPRDGS